MSRPIEDMIRAPLDLDIIIASPSFPFLSTADTLRDDLAVDDELADDDAEWRRRGACSPEPVASAMVVDHGRLIAIQ
jgi:hypothetical protein